MEKRLVTYKPISGQLVSTCCLKKVELERIKRPGEGTTCPTCGTYLKCCWLDFNQAKSYRGLEVYQQKTNTDDFIALSAIIISRPGEISKDLARKFLTLFDNVEESCLEKCEVIDSPKGREYIFNRNIIVKETRVVRLGEDVFVLLGKVSKEELNKKDEILEIKFNSKSKSSLV